MKRPLQSAASSAQQPDRHPNALRELGDLLTTEQAAAALLYEGPRAVANFNLWAHRHRVPRLHRGSRVLWQASVLAAFLKGDKWTRDRHTATLRGIQGGRNPQSVAPQANCGRKAR